MPENFNSKPHLTAFLKGSAVTIAITDFDAFVMAPEGADVAVTNAAGEQFLCKKMDLYGLAVFVET